MSMIIPELINGECNLPQLHFDSEKLTVLFWGVNAPLANEESRLADFFLTKNNNIIIKYWNFKIPEKTIHSAWQFRQGLLKVHGKELLELAQEFLSKPISPVDRSILSRKIDFCQTVINDFKSTEL